MRSVVTRATMAIGLAVIGSANSALADFSACAAGLQTNDPEGSLAALHRP